MVLPKPIVFEWDEGNTEKNPKKHGVKNEETEEAFFDETKIIAKDVLHSASEPRYILLGKTKHTILLYIVFTIRKTAIRVISSRRVHTKEAYLYEKH